MLLEIPSRASMSGWEATTGHGNSLSRSPLEPARPMTAASSSTTVSVALQHRRQWRHCSFSAVSSKCKTPTAADGTLTVTAPGGTTANDSPLLIHPYPKLAPRSQHRSFAKSAEGRIRQKKTPGSWWKLQPIPSVRVAAQPLMLPAQSQAARRPHPESRLPDATPAWRPPMQNPTGCVQIAEHRAPVSRQLPTAVGLLNSKRDHPVAIGNEICKLDETSFPEWCVWRKGKAACGRCLANHQLGFLLLMQGRPRSCQVIGSMIAGCSGYTVVNAILPEKNGLHRMTLFSETICQSRRGGRQRGSPGTFIDDENDIQGNRRA